MLLALRIKTRLQKWLIHETRNTLHDKYEEDPYAYSIMTRQTMDKMDDKYESNDKIHMKNLKQKAEITLLNGRNIVHETWKDKMLH